MLSTSHQLILGSQSPRRLELLQKAGVEFTQRVIETDESYPDTLSLDKVAEHIALAKSQAHFDLLKDKDLVITADTIVVHEGKVYGKPKSKDEAISTILLLSNEVHLVYTAVCLMSLEKTVSFTEMSEVKFGTITKVEAEQYVKNDKPMDKAGSYGIQDWIGFTRIEWIKGSYTNILGLPMAQVWDALKAF